jgi:ATP-dependent RNA helicase DDX21
MTNQPIKRKRDRSPEARKNGKLDEHRSKKLKDEDGEAASEVIEVDEGEIDIEQNDLKNYRISKETRKLLKAKGINALFPIQSSTFDLIYDGRDVVGRGMQ